jgi:hypothetical protein
MFVTSLKTSQNFFEEVAVIKSEFLVSDDHKEGLIEL